jgi:hypothetical protein
MGQSPTFRDLRNAGTNARMTPVTHDENRLYSDSEEVLQAYAHDAKNRHVLLLTELRKKEKRRFLLRGQISPEEYPKKGRFLVEILLNSRVATTDYHESIGILDYRPVQKGKAWWACRYSIDGDRQEKLVRRYPCPSEEAAWEVCGLWYHCNHARDVVRSYQEIGEPPINCSDLTVEDIQHTELALINLQKLHQPHLFDLCLELGLHAVVHKGDERVEIAQLKDAALMTGEWNRKLEEKYPGLLVDLVHLAQLSRKNTTVGAKRRRKAVDYMVRNWIKAGLCFLTRRKLAGLMNHMFKTAFKPKTLDRLCQRLKLPSKHDKKTEPRPLSGPSLEELLKFIQE